MFSSKYRSLLCPEETVTAAQLETDRNLLAFGRSVDRLSRRRFLGGLSGATALAVGAGFIAMPKGFAQATTAAPSITDVLNFALNLEYLEANLYSIVSTGKPIPTSLSGTPGALTGSPGKLTLDAPTLALAQALAQDEQNHINDLRTAITSLGGTPISQPAINYRGEGCGHHAGTVPGDRAAVYRSRQRCLCGRGAAAGQQSRRLDDCRRRFSARKASTLAR